MEPKTHTCTAECWAYMIRYGQPEGCDPWTASAAAEAEAIAEGALIP